MWTIELNVLNQANNSMAAHFSNLARGKAGLIALEYEMLRVGGCGELTATVSRALEAGHSVSIGNLVEVYVASSAEARTRRYKGIIVRLEKDYVAGTMEIGAWGYWQQFDAQIVCKFYSGAAVDTMIGSIFDDIKAQTYCNTSASVSVGSPVTIGDVEINFDDAASSIRKLAEIQGDIEYGVDANGVFYFRDKVATKRAVFQLGRNVAELKSTQRGDELINDYFIKTKGIVSQGSLIVHEADSTSVSTYKKRSKVVSAPEFTDIDDAIAWAENKVAETKDPATIYEFAPNFSTETHLASNGTIDLYDEAGALIGTFYIEAVKYSYTSGGGFTHSLKVGDIAADLEAAKLISDIERKVKLIETSNFSAERIRHTGYDAFSRYVQENAMASGRYNIFLHEFNESENVNGIGRVLVTTENTQRPLIFKKHLRPSNINIVGEIRTFEIPAGRTIDTLRVYYMMDNYGRYTFDNDDALADWVNGSCADAENTGYIISGSRLVGNPDMPEADRGTLILKPHSWRLFNLGVNDRAKWIQGDKDYFVFKMTDLDGDIGDIPLKMRFMTAAAAGGRRAEFYAEIVSDGGAGKDVTFHLDTYDVLGVAEDSDTSTQDIADYIIVLYHDSVADIAYAEIRTASSVYVDGLTADAVHGAGDYYFYILDMFNSGYGSETGDVGIEWAEIQVDDATGAAMTAYASRDAGANWETHAQTRIAVPWYTYHDFDLSGQGAGDKEVSVKIRFEWPTRVYGMGAAWTGD